MTVKRMDVMLTRSDTAIVVIRLLFSCSYTSCTRFNVKPSFILSTGTIQTFFSWRNIFSAFHKETKGNKQGPLALP